MNVRDCREEFGAVLKKYRNDLGLSLREVQKHTRIVYSALSAIESGDRALGDDLANKLADVFRLEGPERESFLLKAASTRRKDRLVGTARKMNPEVLHYVAECLNKMQIKPEDIQCANLTYQILTEEQGRLQAGNTSIKKQFEEQIKGVMKAFADGNGSKIPVLVLDLKDSSKLFCTLLTARHK